MAKLLPFLEIQDELGPVLELESLLAACALSTDLRGGLSMPMPYPVAGRRVRLGVLAGSAASRPCCPGRRGHAAWPADAVLVATSTISGSRVIAQYLFPFTSTINPRDPKSTWHGVRAPGADAETVVFA